MKIAIDAQNLYPYSSEGTRVYLFNLIRSLSRLDEDNSYTVYFRAEPGDFWHTLVSTNSRFSFKYIKKTSSWTQVDLARSLWADPPDIYFTSWQTMPILRKGKIRTVAVIHGLEYVWWRSYPLIYTAHAADKLLAVSEFTKNELMSKYKVRESKINVVYEGIDLDTYYKRSHEAVVKVKNKYALRGKYIFFLGTLGPRKNLERMIAAFSKLGSILDEHNLTFVLGGAELPSYKEVYAFPKKYGVESRVKFIGKVPQEEVPILLSGAEFFAFVSVSEGFGLPVLEAMACGTPVLTANTGALPEVAGESALSVDPSDGGEIFEGMRKLLIDQPYVKSLISSGYEHIKKFSWENTARGVMESYE